MTLEIEKKKLDLEKNRRFLRVNCLKIAKNSSVQSKNEN
jgi:hypothetical protein